MDTEDAGKIRLGTSVQDQGTAGYANTAWIVQEGADQITKSDIWLNNTINSNLDQNPGLYGFTTMLHEIGHALGLKHPGNYNGENGTSDGPFLPENEDTSQYSIMSYNNGRVKYEGSSEHARTPLLYDIAAIQYLYGKNQTTRKGDDLYTWKEDENFVEAIWDAGGNDTIDASNQTRRSVINLGAGSFSSIGYNKDRDITDNLAIAFDVTIENANGGSGDDEITGNEVGNSLRGNGGNDSLIGGTGSDTFVFQSATEGIDKIQDFNRQEGDKILFDAEAQKSQFKYNAQTGEISFDNQVFVILTNKPTDFSIETDLRISKDTTPVVPEPPVVPASPALIGTDGDDVLISRNDQGDSVLGLAGNDRITGRLGNDTLDGGAGDDFLFGDAGDDTLVGQAGNDSMDGGSGNDSMSGGLGNDSYIVDSNTDVVTEAVNGGIDTVFSSVSYTLSDNVDKLVLTGSSPLDGTANGLDNEIIGNIAANNLYAGDGNDQVYAQAGDDYLHGQAGNDTLRGDLGNDWIVGDLGNDTLLGGAGNDRLIGDFGSDSISGGQGKDQLTGGADVDKFILNFQNKGIDTITDFKSAQGDKIIFSAEGFGKQLKQGKLSPTRFTLGSTAEHEKAGFVYHKPSGSLFFDVDGIGGQKQVQIAQLAGGTALTSNNIFISA